MIKPWFCVFITFLRWRNSLLTFLLGDHDHQSPALDGWCSTSKSISLPYEYFNSAWLYSLHDTAQISVVDSKFSEDRDHTNQDNSPYADTENQGQAGVQMTHLRLHIYVVYALYIIGLSVDFNILEARDLAVAKLFYFSSPQRIILILENQDQTYSFCNLLQHWLYTTNSILVSSWTL